MTIVQIAEEIQRSTATVRHWLRRYDLTTAASVRARAARSGRPDGQLTIERECIRHGRTEFAIEGRGYYRCKRCRGEQVVRHTRTIKETLVAEVGGACALCGYARCLSALDFHHVGTARKRPRIGENGVSPSIAGVRREASRCVLLCSNCHAEVEGGMVALPDTVVSGARG